MTRRRASAGGFTLLEVLVALIVFALAFGGLAQIVQSGFRQSASAEATSTATLLARSLLARVGPEIPLAAGRREGEAADYRWTTVVTPAEREPGEFDVAMYSVVVTVAWGAPGQEQAVELATLRLGTAP